MSDSRETAPEKKLPRGHAYMRFRNNNYTFEVDFPNVNERLVESIMQHAIRTLREHNDRAGCPNGEKRS